MKLALEPQRQALIERIGELARERFAPRAARYDLDAAFPAEDFDDLFRAGLLAPCVPREHGGLGLGPHRGDALTLWLMTKQLAKADLSLAPCWAGHANSLVLIGALADEGQETPLFRRGVQRRE